MIEQISKIIFDELKKFEGLPLSELNWMVNQTDESLPFFLKKFIIEESKSFISNARYNEKKGRIETGLHSYIVTVGIDVLEQDKINVGITTYGMHKDTTKDIKRFSVAFDSNTKYKKVHLFYAKALDVDKGAFKELVSTIILTMGNWCTEEIVNSVKQVDSDLTSNLYHYLRRVVINDNLVNDIWFAVMSKGQGFRVFDQRVARIAFTQLKKHSADYNRSVNDMVSELLSTSLPVEGLLMKKAVDRKVCIDVDITEASYTKEGSSYAETMQAFYGSTAFTIFPILVDRDDNRVVALFSTSNRSSLEPILSSHQKGLSQICLESLDMMKRISVIMKKARTSVNFSNAGEFIGSAIGAVIKSSQGP